MESTVNNITDSLLQSMLIVTSLVAYLKIKQFDMVYCWLLY